VGLNWPAMALLLREHQEAPFEGPVLLLGRQNLDVTYQGLLELLPRAGVTPAVAEGAANQRTGLATDTDFFRLLGVGEVSALDVSAFEGADIVADLNYPVDASLHGRFGLIFDGGTAEHVFDTRQCFMNVANMLRPGGRVIHSSPVNNHVNHGFYQFSPTLFFDYYAANGFVDARAIMAVYPRCPDTTPWHCFAYQPDVHGGINAFYSNDNSHLGILFSARKTAESTSGKIPIQSLYTRIHSEGNHQSWQQFLLKYAPDQLRIDVLTITPVSFSEADGGPIIK
jgi:SAM-dependent methyltransferase